MKAVAVVVKPKSPYIIPKPDDWEFRNDDQAENGEYIVVKVKAQGDNQLKIIEIEGIPVGDEVNEADVPAQKFPSIADIMPDPNESSEDESQDGTNTSNEEED